MTTRANPASSFSSACRHLFRHLYEPEQLRQNPLVSWYFSPQGSEYDDENSAQAIRRTVRSYAEIWLKSASGGSREDIAKRQYDVFTRSDLERVGRNALCAEFGLSYRQFCRDQAVIRDRIATMLAQRARIAIARYSAVSEQVGSAALAQALQLDGFGKPCDALALLDDILQTSTDEVHKVEALRIQSGIYLTLNRVERTEQLLDHATSVLARVHDRVLSARLACEIALVRADLFNARGHTSQAANHGDFALHLLDEALDGSDPHLGEVRARALASVAVHHRNESAMERAIALARRAIDLAKERADLSPRGKIGLLINAGGVLSNVPLEHAATYRLYRDALDTAREHGLIADVVLTETLIANKHLRCGRFEEARLIFEQCIPVAQRLQVNWLLAFAVQGLTDLGLITGTPRGEQLLKYATDSMNLAPEGSALWVKAKVAESLALLQAGDAAGALAAANDADEHIARNGALRYRTMTLRSRAIVYDQIGDHQTAVSIMQRSLKDGQAYSNEMPHQLALTFEVAAKVLGNEAYALEARHIWEGLRYPA